MLKLNPSFSPFPTHLNYLTELIDAGQGIHRCKGTPPSSPVQQWQKHLTDVPISRKKQKTWVQWQSPKRWKSYIHATAVFSTTGGMALEASQFLKHLAEKISLKKGQRYSDVMSFVRRRLRFDLLRTCIISIRGYRGTRTLPPTAISDLDLNLINTPKS